MTMQRWTGRETRLLRHALRLTVRAFADDLGVSPRTVSKWEAAGSLREPRPELQAALDTVLQRAGPVEQARFAASVGTEPERQVPAPTRDVLSEAADDATGFVLWWEQAAAGEVSLDVLHAELRRTAHDYLSGSPEPALRALTTAHETLLGLLRRPQGPSTVTDLHLLAGFAGVLLGWISGDLGRPATADVHVASATLFARTSGSSELAAWVQAVRSKTAFWSERYGEAAREAARGLDIAPPSGVRILLAAQVADAWASAGNTAAAEAALTDLVDARQTNTGSDSIGGLLSFSPAREANYVSGVHQQLGRPGEAVALADEALHLAALAPTRSYATEAQMRLNQVDAFLDAADLDGAGAALAPVLALPVERRLTTLTARVSRYGPLLADSRYARHRLARQIRDDIAAFTEPAAAR